ncbi:TPA: DNA-binding response regulator, partial [Klebsiella aerogenes]|nr:DNA-binding response regulator [Klebsiella aerogenes]
DLLFEVVGEAMAQQKAHLERQQILLPLQEKLATLTAREHEMLQQLLQGYSSKEIARLCSLSPRTVEAHRANIFSKLEVNSLPKLLKIYADVASGAK